MLWGLLSLFFFQVARLFFYFRNQASFEGLNFFELIRAFIWGLRFDLSVLSYIFLSAFAIKLILYFIHKDFSQKVYRFFMVFAVATACAFCLADAEFFFVNHKHLDSTLFHIGGDFKDQLPQYFKNYFYVFLSWFFVVFVLYFFSKNKKAKKSLLSFVLSLFLWIPIGIIGARGGFQEKALGISHSLLLNDSRLSDIALNAPFVIMQTSRKKTELSVARDFSFQEARSILITQRPHSQDKALQKLSLLRRPQDNVVVFILESFSNEYSYAAPFLMSLKNKGISFERHFSNGRTSIESIPAIFASLPSLLAQPYITSPFSTSRLASLPGMIDKNQRDIIFMHGARKGSMYFDAFTSYLGFNYYFGKEDFKGPASSFYDWGVHDHAFLKFSGETLAKWKKPFLASIFTLSSHQPYEIPLEFQKIIPEEKSPFVRSLRYADRSLEIFFNENKNKKWFQNTLFIFTGDHTSQCQGRESCSQLGSHSVPLIVYHGSNMFKALKFYKPTQHADLPATIASYLGLPTQKLLPFGHSIFDAKDAGLAVFRDHHEWQLIQSNGFFKLKEFWFEKCEVGQISERDCKIQTPFESQVELKYLKALRSYFTQSLERRSFTD
jgi:phosphoglycerol transferase MdoB-like AlkP superfamily enzyme